MKKDITRAAIGVIAIAAICYGLAAAMPPASAPSVMATTPAGSDRVVMRVNGEAVTEREFNVFLQQVPEQMRATPEGRKMLAGEIVKLKVLEQEAERLGVDRDKDVATRLEMTRTSALASLAVQKLMGTPDEKRLRAAYENERAQYESSELSHILIAYEGGAIPPRNGRPVPVEQALAKARSIAGRVRSGANFADEARRESDDVQSAANGGSLGPVSPASLPANLRAATQDLAPGQISDPVRSEFGIHIFRAGERKSQPFEAVREALAAKMQRDDAEAAIQRLEKSAKVELDPKFFPPGPPQQKPRT